MSYYGGKRGAMDVTTMPGTYLFNARNKLAKKLAAGEDTGKNDASTLAELDAELDRRRSENPPPTTTTAEPTPAPAEEDDGGEVPW
jgi:hypothetical protein